ncbi:MAG: hypothetical protein OXR67_17580 [Chloroflexota bacterium]|nr:hypothetical protein [Chloroflexota bacterium]
MGDRCAAAGVALKDGMATTGSYQPPDRREQPASNAAEFSRGGKEQRRDTQPAFPNSWGIGEGPVLPLQVFQMSNRGHPPEADWTELGVDLCCRPGSSFFRGSFAGDDSTASQFSPVQE